MRLSYRRKETRWRAVAGIAKLGLAQSANFVADTQAPSGSVRVTAIAGLFEIIRMEWLDEFYARYPNINIEFLLNDAPADMIAERIDLALRMGIETGSGFKVRRLAPNALILAASPAYLKSQHVAPARSTR